MNINTLNPRDLLIVGAGGAGQEALWVAQRQNELGSRRIWNVIGFVDDNPQLANTVISGTRVVGPQHAIRQEYRGRDVFVHYAIGNNEQRKQVAKAWSLEGFRGATLIDPTAVIAPNAEVGEGSYVGPLAYVGPQARLGRFVLVNVTSSVGHHAVCGSYSQVCPGARLSGHTKLGDGAFVGSNAVLAPGAAVGEGSTVAASSFVAREVPGNATAIGVPAKVLAAPPAAV